MMGKTHVAGGLLFGATASLIVQKNFPEIISQNEMLFCISTAILSSMCARLPDIDKKESTIGRKLWFLSWPIYLLQCIVKIPAMLGINIFKRASKGIDHRGFTHYPTTWLAITIMAAVLGRTIYKSNLTSFTQTFLISCTISLSIGILSHLAYDFISGKIKLFAPLSLKGYGVRLVKDRGILEFIILMGSYMAAVKLIVNYYLNII